jgi:O-acetyl-ADP-ribose deacetylase (regulator of RNase III)
MLHVNFVDRNEHAISALECAFANVDNVTATRGNISQPPVTGPSVAIATPGNSFGNLDGGADRAVNYFLSSPTQMLSDDLKALIRDRFYGEQPVGTCLLI